MLAGAIGTLRTLAAAHAELPAFLAWDAERTVEVLALIDVAVPPVEGEPLEERHRRVRAELEARVPELSADPEARRRHGRPLPGAGRPLPPHPHRRPSC